MCYYIKFFILLLHVTSASKICLFQFTRLLCTELVLLTKGLNSLTVLLFYERFKIFFYTFVVALDSGLLLQNISSQYKLLCLRKHVLGENVTC